MAQTAAHLVDHVIPPVPVRQWVISVPKRRRSRKRLRGMLADRPRAVAALTKIFLDEIERLLCAAAASRVTPPRDPVVPACGSARRRGRRRHARLGEQRVFHRRFSCRSRSSTAMCPAIFGVSNTCCGSAPGPPSLAIGNVGKRRDAVAGGLSA